MSCSPEQVCPTWATCCDGSNPACSGTRLPEGDGTNPGQFVVAADGLTVSDTNTYLVWQRDGSGTRKGCSGTGNLTCAWAEANTYCAGLQLGTLTGWRLPSHQELRTIVDFTQYNPAIDLATFPDTAVDWYWSSTPYGGSSGAAWYVSFANGAASPFDEADYDRVRCVR